MNQRRTMPHVREYEEMPTSKPTSELFRLAEQILGERREIERIIQRLEEIKYKFSQRPLNYKQRLKVVWPED